MIPRLKPYFDYKEILSALKFWNGSIEEFERKFADVMECNYAVTFSYGRSAIFSILRALDIENSEIIMPAYTCIVVANAVVKSGNIPVFVDIEESDFNMNLDEVEKKITYKTKAIIATSLFGYPVKLDKLKQIKDKIRDDIIIIQDCALAFGTRYESELVNNCGDFAIYGLNAGKQLCTLQGGIATTNNNELFEKIKKFKDKNFRKQTFIKRFWWILYLIGLYFGFKKPIFNITYFLSEKTPLLNRFTKYYSEDKIYLPEDFQEFFSDVQARIGIEQLNKINDIINKRIEISERFTEELKNIDGFLPAPIIKGATYSHYPARIKKRNLFLKKMNEKNINCGYLFEYSVPYLKSFEKYKTCEYHNSLKISKEVVNIPNYPDLSENDCEYIINTIKEIMESL